MLTSLLTESWKLYTTQERNQQRLKELLSPRKDKKPGVGFIRTLELLYSGRKH